MKNTRRKVGAARCVDSLRGSHRGDFASSVAERRRDRLPQLLMSDRAQTRVRDAVQSLQSPNAAEDSDLGVESAEAVKKLCKLGFEADDVAEVRTISVSCDEFSKSIEFHVFFFH